MSRVSSALPQNQPMMSGSDQKSTPSMDHSTGSKRRRSPYNMRARKPRGDVMELGPAPLGDTAESSIPTAVGLEFGFEIGTQYGHFLTTKILWEHCQVEDLANMNTAVRKALDLPNWAEATAEEYVSGYEDWSRFIDHIAKYPIANPRLCICQRVR
ncbi:hypothetical protein N7445_002213 [Penicillium cf. griseofulvum]|nr:hypothetical protein N7445_002213 [Penicillium cf. griseofulvum]